MKNNLWHIQLNETEYMGGVKFLANGTQMSMRHASQLKDAYHFWIKSVAEEVLPFIQKQFPQAKIIKRG